MSNDNAQVRPKVRRLMVAALTLAAISAGAGYLLAGAVAAYAYRPRTSSPWRDRR